MIVRKVAIRGQVCKGSADVGSRRTCGEDKRRNRDRLATVMSRYRHAVAVVDQRIDGDAAIMATQAEQRLLLDRTADAEP